MKLIYRAQICEYSPRPTMPYRKPYAINWRFQVPGETYGDTLIPVLPYRQPRAINWRFQIAET